MLGYRGDLWEIAASRNGVVTVAEAGHAGVPAVEVRKLAVRGALRGYGQGVYTHRYVQTTPFTEPTIAVALGGAGAFLHRESVLNMLGLGQFNPPKVRVGTRRRVRRTLPEWMELENRPDVLESISPATRVSRRLPFGGRWKTCGIGYSLTGGKLWWIRRCGESWSENRKPLCGANLPNFSPTAHSQVWRRGFHPPLAAEESIGSAKPATAERTSANAAGSSPSRRDRMRHARYFC